MKFSQMLSMLNGLLLSTNVVAITFNTTDALELHADDSSSWSYNYTQPTAKEPNFMYLIAE